MVNLFVGLLVSTDRNRERQCASEMFYVLTEHIKIPEENLYVAETGISGLVTIKTRNLDPLEVTKKLKEFLEKQEENYMIETRRIVPIQKVIKTDIEKITESAVKLFGNRKGKWRITIRKRHHTMDRDSLINSIATKIQEPVDLENYEWDLRIEILGPLTGISVFEKGLDLRLTTPKK